MIRLQHKPAPAGFLPDSFALVGEQCSQVLLALGPNRLVRQAISVYTSSARPSFLAHLERYTFVPRASSIQSAARATCLAPARTVAGCDDPNILMRVGLIARVVPEHRVMDEPLHVVGPKDGVGLYSQSLEERQGRRCGGRPGSRADSSPPQTERPATLSSTSRSIVGRRVSQRLLSAESSRANAPRSFPTGRIDGLIDWRQAGRPTGRPRRHPRLAGELPAGSGARGPGPARPPAAFCSTPWKTWSASSGCRHGPGSRGRKFRGS